MKDQCCIKEHSSKSITLIQKTAYIGSAPHTYCLRVTSSDPCRFFVTVKEEGGIGVTTPLGTDLGVATTIFELLVEHTVAPCHLTEIVEELLEKAVLP